MPKYKVDFRVVRIQGNRAEVKDNNGKLSWYHISDIKKTDMVTKLICQLPDVMHLVEQAGSALILNVSRILAGYQMTGPTNLVQIIIKRCIVETVKNTPKQRSHQMELRSRDK